MAKCNQLTPLSFKGFKGNEDQDCRGCCQVMHAW